MIWTLPVAPPLKVTYTVNPQDAWVLWSSVRKVPQESRGGKEVVEEEEKSIDLEEVIEFMQGLKSHFYRHYRLDLSAGSLNQVSTALGSAKYNGRIKVSSDGNASTKFFMTLHCSETHTGKQIVVLIFVSAPFRSPTADT